MLSIAHMITPVPSILLEVMQNTVARFARKAEVRVSIPGCMAPWNSDQKLVSWLRLQSPDYLIVHCLLRLGALPYSPSYHRLMSTFLQTVVCTPLNKAADTFVFQCPYLNVQIYAHDLTTDLQQAGTY